MDKTVPVTSSPPYSGLTREEAQREFEGLVEDQRTRSLWFLNPSLPIDITGPYADTMLDHIAQHGSRRVWLAARKLKKWRLHHTR